MKKWSLFLLCALLLMPLNAQAEDLPEVLGAVVQGLSEGLSEGAQAAGLSAQELTLALTAEDARIEEGRTLLLTIAAGNPYPAAADVTLTLDLPDRLSCAQPLTWTAQLEAAAVDPATGALVPSAATFTREVTLLPGGSSEQTQVLAELAMGTRFYRAALPLELCVPEISAEAVIEGAEDAFIEAGDPFEYVVTVANTGSAPKDVPVSLLIPDGTSPDGALPAGFVLRDRIISGAVRAESMSDSTIRLPMRVDSDALNGDEDAFRLMRGVLAVDEKSVALPMIKTAGAKISAALTPQTTKLEQGEITSLTITVANTGLAPADVEIACRLPEGLTMLHDLTQEPAAQKDSPDESDVKEEETPLGVPGGTDDSVPPADGAAQTVMSEQPAEPVIREEDGLVLLSLHMDGAKETEQGAAAATQEIALRVRADMPMDDVSDRLLGASLAWKTTDGETRLGEAVALQIDSSGMMGLSPSEWNGILLAALLMLVTVCCLYSAVKSDDKQDDYCFE